MTDCDRMYSHHAAALFAYILGEETETAVFAVFFRHKMSNHGARQWLYVFRANAL